VRQVHCVAEEGLGAALCEHEREEPHQHRAAHDEGKRGIPGAENVEKADHLARIGHAREDETDAEDKACGESGEGAHGKCLATNTVAMPARMNAAVATSERGESRDSPHTPWPLVQPEP
jgi:hypothetical protein